MFAYQRSNDSHPSTESYRQGVGCGTQHLIVMVTVRSRVLVELAECFVLTFGHIIISSAQFPKGYNLTTRVELNRVLTLRILNLSPHL